MSDVDHSILINEQDCKATWGLVFLKGTYEELLKFPKRKENFTQSFPDENGTLRQTDNLVYESITYKIQALIIADTRADFLAKLSSFSNYMLAAGYFDLDVVALNIRFRLLYAGAENFELKRRVSSGENAMLITLTLINDFPGNYPAIPQNSGSGNGD